MNHEILKKDLGLTAEQLDDKYNLEGDGEHPVITRMRWRMAVDFKETISGYWDWVVYTIQQEVSKK